MSIILYIFKIILIKFKNIIFQPVNDLAFYKPNDKYIKLLFNFTDEKQKNSYYYLTGFVTGKQVLF